MSESHTYTNAPRKKVSTAFLYHQRSMHMTLGCQPPLTANLEMFSLRKGRESHKQQG